MCERERHIVCVRVCVCVCVKEREREKKKSKIIVKQSVYKGILSKQIFDLVFNTRIEKNFNGCVSCRDKDL